MKQKPIRNTGNDPITRKQFVASMKSMATAQGAAIAIALKVVGPGHVQKFIDALDEHIESLPEERELHADYLGALISGVYDHEEE